ncbi:hypothetical protein CC86DRAFT_461889 [Ophiobolus disseminans]|uniref:Zn(2)-C6 fungal-type domain-containing protein n=1 Tax=Ophiobolus disseminans TaxID=1469910 RepID=A0A6A7ALD6_9PLEO|nr:hypothetical protein CC86DRAFT_461889 [Ophiobolus disseminans]
MSHRHSCDRCRQQKVRCLRDELPSTGQPLPPCERCNKANVACVYSLKQRTKRPVETRKDASSEMNLGSMGDFRQGLTVDVAFPRGGPLSSDFSDLANSFPPAVDEGAGGCIPGFDGWDTNNLQLFSPISSSLPLQRFNGDALRDQDMGTASSDDDEQVIDVLTSQLTGLSERAMRAKRSLVRPDSATLTVSSPQVNNAYEDANTLIRVLNSIATSLYGNMGHTAVDDGLVFLALASYEHLLALFRAICDAVSQRLECKASGLEQQQGSLHGDGPCPVAQYVMVLQLLMHLINRLDRSLFQTRAGSESSGSGGQVTPVIPAGYTCPLLMDMEDIKCAQGLPMLAQTIVQAIPNRLVELRHVIQELQLRIEHSEYL